MKPHNRQRLPLSVWSVALVIGLLVIATSSKAGEALTLDRVIRETLANNGQFASAKQMAQSATAKARSAGAWDDPMLMLGVANLPTNFDFRMDPMTMTMVGLSQTIPWAGQKGLSARAAGQSAQAAGAMSDQTAVDLLVSARRAYYDLYFKQQILFELRRQREVYSELVQTATDRYRIGLGGQEDVTTAQAAAYRFESQIRSAEQEELAAEYRLGALIGSTLGDNPSLEPPADEMIPSADSLWTSPALKNYSALKRLSFQREGYDLSARSSRRMLWPMLTLSAAYGIRRDGPLMDGVSEKRDNMVSFQANVSLPIFAGKREGQMARSMDYMSLSVSAEKSQMERDMVAQVRSLFVRATKLRESIDGYTSDVIPAVDQSYQGALASYRTSKMTLGSLLNYLIQPINDRMTLLQLRLDLAMTISESMRYTTDPATLSVNFAE
jgi:outer membrane protein TolC